jgi:hypothetical protein
MTTTDKLLERLVKRVNETGTFLDITLVVGGAMITGRLAPRSKWLEGNIAALNQAQELKGFADEFAAEGGALDTEAYVHLSGAKKVFGEGLLPTSGSAFRVPITEVQGWMIGSMR